MEQWKSQPRDSRQRFASYRVNCESVPCLPVWAVRWVLDDPRGIPYLLVWRWLDRGEVREALRVSRTLPPVEGVELKRTDGTSQVVETVRRPLPRNGGSALLLVCPHCGGPRRTLYGWSVCAQQLLRSLWQCRTCAGLRYRSEGTPPSSFARLVATAWDPCAFANPWRGT
jgi:hypothetical protein